MKKKAPEIIDTIKAGDSEPVEPTAPTPPQAQAPPETEVISPYLKDLSKYIHELYGGYFTVQDAANTPDVVHKSETIVILIGIYDELRIMRELMQKE